MHTAREAVAVRSLNPHVHCVECYSFVLVVHVHACIHLRTLQEGLRCEKQNKQQIRNSFEVSRGRQFCKARPSSQGLLYSLQNGSAQVFDEKKVTQENILVSNYPSRRPNLEMLSPAYINKSDLLTMTQNDFLRFWRLGAGLAGILIRILTTPNLDTRTLVIDLRPRPSINRFISLFISDCCGWLHKTVDRESGPPRSKKALKWD